MKLLARWLAVVGLLAGLAAAQTFPVVLPPVPPNPNDPVSGSVQILSSPAERAAALNLLNQAGQDYTLGQQGTPDMEIWLTLQSSGGLRFEGSGTMTQVWSGGRRLWWSDFDNQTSGLNYQLQSHPVPLRVAQARTAVLWPLQPLPTWKEIRAVNASWNGAAVTCVLVNRGVSPPRASGRDWQEAEYCLGAGSRLLLFSPAPGMFYEYDYEHPWQYAGHDLASAIHLIEGQQTVMTIQITQFGPPSPEDLDTLRHVRNLPAIIGMWRRGLVTIGHPLTAVCVLQYTANPAGQLLEGEAIPCGDPALEQQALAWLQHARFPRRPRDVLGLIRYGGQ